jgi:hypothetical protein
VYNKLKRVLRHRPSSHIIAFIRTNVAKSVISAVRGGITHELCGADNLRKEEAVKCVIPKMVTIDPSQFKKMVIIHHITHAEAHMKIYTHLQI